MYKKCTFYTYARKGKYSLYVKNMLQSGCSFSDKFEQSLLKKQPRLPIPRLLFYLFNFYHQSFEQLKQDLR